MPQVLPLASQGLVRAGIERAATRTSVDFNYLLGQARIESRLNPSARAPNSSASGLYQFLSTTWLDTIQKHGAEHGLGWAAAQIEQTAQGPVVRDPAARAQILGLRFDPDVSSLMAGEFARDNGDALRASIGREPNNTDLYLAHFLGPAGASDFLRTLQASPGLSAAGLFPKAAAANRAIFYAADGSDRSLGDVYGLLTNKLQAAIDRGGEVDPAAGGLDFAEVQLGTIPLPGQAVPAMPVVTQTKTTSSEMAPPTSMADLLRTTFAVDPADTGPANANVRKAYDILREFNL